MSFLISTSARRAPAAASVAWAWPTTRLAAPLVGFFLIQSAASLANLAIVGRLGDAAVAAVGAGSAVFAILVALFSGLDAGVQPLASRLAGAGDRQGLRPLLVQAERLGVTAGVALGLLAWFAGPSIATALAGPQIGAQAGHWLRLAAPALPAFGATIPVNAIWIGSGRPGRPLLVYLAISPVQVIATWALVRPDGSGLGPAGAGLALTLGAWAGVGVQAILVWRSDLAARSAAPSPRILGRIVRLGWPVGLQQAMLQGGLMAAFPIVSVLGPAALAQVNVLINLGTVPSQVSLGLGVAGGTLVGQAMGRGDPSQARRAGWRALVLGLISAAPFTLLALIWPHALLWPFLRTTATAQATVAPLRWLGLTVLTSAASQVLIFAMRGAGATRLGAGVPLALQWLVELPLCWLAAIPLGMGVTGLVAARSLCVALEAAFAAAIWVSGAWTRPAALRSSSRP